MQEPILELISYLEEDLAAFYLKAEKLTRYQSYRTLFDSMERESIEHSEIIKKIDLKLTKPVFNRMGILEIQEMLKNKLWDYVTKEENEIKVIQKMSDAEMTISNLYHSIAEHCRGMSAYYVRIAKEIDELSKQEIEHKETLLNYKAI